MQNAGSAANVGSVAITGSAANTGSAATAGSAATVWSAAKDRCVANAGSAENAGLRFSQNRGYMHKRIFFCVPSVSPFFAAKSKLDIFSTSDSLMFLLGSRFKLWYSTLS